VEADCITDNLTGLMWPRNANLTPMTWDEAIDYAVNLSLCGHSGWSLANINELQSLTHSGVSNSGAWLSTQGFMGLSAATYPFWSSTTVDRMPANALSWNPYTGEEILAPKNAVELPCRCVRPSQVASASFRGSVRRPATGVAMMLLHGPQESSALILRHSITILPAGTEEV
jgi:hypothetical protein